jgi:hypothetical protein
VDASAVAIWDSGVKLATGDKCDDDECRDAKVCRNTRN